MAVRFACVCIATSKNNIFKFSLEFRGGAQQTAVYEMNQAEILEQVVLYRCAWK